MLKKAASGLAILALPLAASAQWEGTVGYSSIDIEPSYTLGAIVLGVGYRLPVTDALSIAPGARVGFGIKDDNVSITTGIMENGEPDRVTEIGKLEVEQFYGLQLRADYDFGNGIYLLAVPSYSKLELELSGESNNSADYRFSDSDWGFGIGVGGGIQLSDFVSAEVSYERMDVSSRDVDVLSFQARFSF